MKLKYVFNCLFFGLSVLIISAQNTDNEVIAHKFNNSFTVTKKLNTNYSLDYGLADLVAYSLNDNKNSIKCDDTVNENAVIKNALRVFPKALTNNHNSNIIEDKTIETKINLL